MKQITVMVAGLALRPESSLRMLKASDTRRGSIHPTPDLTHRSNPQDLLTPGGYNRQDLVRPASECERSRPGSFRSDFSSHGAIVHAHAAVHCEGQTNEKEEASPTALRFRPLRR